MFLLHKWVNGLVTVNFIYLELKWKVWVINWCLYWSTNRFALAVSPDYGCQFVWVWICVCVHVSVCLYIHLCVWVHVHEYVHVYACECMRAYGGNYVCVCMGIWAYWHIHEYVPICVYTCMRRAFCACKHVLVRVPLLVGVCARWG